MRDVPLAAPAAAREARMPERLPPAQALAFVLASSALLWALIGWGVTALLR